MVTSRWRASSNSRATAWASGSRTGIDASKAVVIDPLLMGASYSGQVGASNYGHCATYDQAGNMYGGAQNFGAGLPVTVGAFQTTPGSGITDIVVNKLTPDATTLVWATYIGGSSDDKPHSMIVSSNNELCILGSSTGTGFPVSAGAYDASQRRQRYRDRALERRCDGAGG